METPAQSAAPQLVYVPNEESLLRPDPAVLDRVSGRDDPGEIVEELTIPVRDGRAWKVPAGHVCRFSIVEGPQVIDLNLWNDHDPRERFWVSRTRQFYGPHVTVGDRLWSNVPFMRPLATVVGDTVAYGTDADGAGCHDLLGTRCDPYVGEVLSHTEYDFYCHSNIVRAVHPFGLTEFDVHDVINVFQVTGLMPGDGRYFVKPCPAKPGDYFELFAEIDLLMAASTCPGGDLSVPLWGPGAGAEPSCRPVEVQVLRQDPALLEGWESPPASGYRGMDGVRHGLALRDERPPLTEAKPA
jgi:uncharacterized protein